MDSHELDELREMLATGRKIEAIKRIRERTWLGLKEAKELSELIEEGAGLMEVSQRLQQLGVTPPAPVPASGRDDAIAEALRRGNKIEAIKLYRERRGVDLRTAKEAVEAMMTGGPSAWAPSVGRRSAGPARVEDFDDVVAAVDNGQLILAIKLYREHTGVGLKDAKDAVDDFRSRRR